MSQAIRQDAIYALGYTDEERQRLTEQGELFRSCTSRLLQDAGLGPGAHVLDVGCGVGDVSILASSLVGPNGSVVGIDIDPRSLALARQRVCERGLANVTFTEGDFREFVSPQLFDAVVGRFVLMYPGDPAAAVAHLAGLVRPGGVIVFQESDFHCPHIARPGTVDTWREAFERVKRVFEACGFHTRIGLGLYDLFVEAGLPPPHMHIDVHVVTPADVLGPKVAAHTLRSLMPILERFRLGTPEQLDPETYADRLQADLAASRAVTGWPPLVSAWTRL
jgi:SAM-dependent methyltransferase